MAVLCTWAPEGGMLGVVAPLALAASQRTALLVDLDHDGPRYPGTRSLADLVAESPTRADLIPPRSGVAVLRNGGVRWPESRDVVAALARGWPRLVLRLGPAMRTASGYPVVPIHALLPGAIAVVDAEEPAVYQRCGWQVRPRGPGPVLPRPRRATVGALLEGRRPAADRWLRSWRAVWGASWT